MRQLLALLLVVPALALAGPPAVSTAPSAVDYFGRSKKALTAPSITVTGEMIGKVTAIGSSAGRTPQERAADVLNVLDFGAKGDGVTNDAPAIQAALNAAAAGGTRFTPATTVVIPGGRTYAIASGLTFATTGHQTVTGYGAVLKATAAMTDMLRLGTPGLGTGAPEQVQVKGISLDANSLAQNGLRLVHAQNYRLSDLKVLNAVNAGFYLDGGSANQRILNVQLDNCYAVQCGIGFLEDQNGNLGSFASFQHNSCGAELCATSVKLIGGRSQWVGGTFQAASAFAVHASGGMHQFVGSYFENGGAGGQHIYATGGAKLWLPSVNMGAVTFGDASATVIQDGFAYANSNGWLPGRSALNNSADYEHPWGNPVWPVWGQSGAIHVRGQTLEDQAGNRWRCVTPGATGTGTYVPADGLLKIPFDMTQSTPFAMGSGVMMWWAQEDFVVESVLLVVTTPFAGGSLVSFGSGTNVGDFISTTQGAVANLTAGAVISSFNNAGGTALLSNGKAYLMAGKGGAVAGSKAGSGLYMNSTGTFTAGAGYILIRGRSLKW